VVGLCCIMQQFCAGLCDRSVLDYMAVLCWIMWQAIVGLCS
jgi:hypothetical protein